jgi:nitrite reductase/ring-hydroxylating ferredoxin subunit
MQRLAALSELPVDGIIFDYKEGPFDEQGILIRTRDGVKAYKNECRHLPMRLDDREPAEIWDEHNRYLVCNSHGARYRPDDGLCVSGPCEGSHLKELPVIIDGNDVFLDTDKVGGFFNV